LQDSLAFGLRRNDRQNDRLPH